MDLSFSAIIPSAGNSVRMGEQKALLPYGNGLNFAQHLSGGFSGFGCVPVVMVVNRDFGPCTLPAKNLILVVNENVEKGRSHSTHLGLQQVPAGSACFILNIDNPFPAVSLLTLLLSSLPHKGYAVPVFQGRGGHPVLLGPEMADLLRIKTELTDFRQLLQGFDRVEVPSPDDRILWNINTPEEYHKFLLTGRSGTG